MERNRKYNLYIKIDEEKQNYLRCWNRMTQEKTSKQLLQHKQMDTEAEVDLEKDGNRTSFLPRAV